MNYHVNGHNYEEKRPLQNLVLNLRKILQKELFVIRNIIFLLHLAREQKKMATPALVHSNLP